MKMNMGVVVGGPAIAAVVIAGGLAWATNFAARTAAPERGTGLAHACAEQPPGGPAAARGGDSCLSDK